MPFGADRDRAAGRRVARRVREQVRQHLGEVVGVGPGREPVRELHLHAKTGPLEGRLREVQRRADRRRKVDFLERRGSSRRIAFGERVERMREANQALGLVPERVVGGPVGDDDPVAQRLEIALQVGQRRPKLVRGVGDEVAPHRLLALEAGGHLVERIGEARELLRAVARDAGGVIPFGDPARGGTDLGDRSGEHPGEEDRQRDARDGRHGDRGEDHGRDRPVVHRLGVVGRDADLGHQRAEDLGPDDSDPDRQDRQPDAGRDEGRQRDPRRDPTADHDRAAR